MSSSSKFKKFSVDSMRLVGKDAEHKRDRSSISQTLRNAVRNNFLEDDDEEDSESFFNFQEDLETELVS